MNKRILAGVLALMMAFPLCASARVRQFDQGEIQEKHFSEGGYDAGYDPNYDCNETDTQEVKYYIDEYFTFTSKADVWFDDRAIPSGWDVRHKGGEIKGGYYVPFQLIDTSNELPVEAARKFEDAAYGEFILDFTAKFDSVMNGASFRIYGDRDIALSIEIKDGKWSFLKADGSYLPLTEAKVGTEYGVRVIFDAAAKRAKSVYINGKMINTSFSFVNPVERVNSFAINTGDAATGTITVTTVQLSRGYRIYDRFLGYGGQMPNDYVVKNGSANLVEVPENSYPDQYSMSFSSNTKVEKIFTPLSGKLEYGFHVIIPDANDKSEIGIKNGSTNIISFYSSNGKIGYNANGQKKDVYNFRANVWYYLRFIVDLDAKTADMYVNNRLMDEKIPIDAVASADTFCIETQSVKSAVRADDFYVQPFVPEPEDYVPEPQPVSTGDYRIGMQFCPMWVNGHHVGWDSINYDKDRLPYLGYYDENSPETIDWMIKQMVEHGMDFARVAWCMQPDNDNPVNKPFFGYSFINALQQAKYKDMIDYMVIWESVTMGSSADILVNSVGPYWIEHYLKDENYLRIDGRPVISFLYTWPYVEGSGSVEKAAEGLQTFRQMCIDAGVGNPIITTGDWGEDDIAVGFDGVSDYFAPSGNQITALKNGYNSYEGVTNYMMPVSMGFDATVWKASVYGWDTPETFKRAMVYARDEYMSKQSDDNLFKNYLMIETYDEFGEGHYPAPAGLYGYAYFDAIREVFTDNPEHTDVVPTMAQKDRFNNLYPYGRDVGQMDKPVKPVKAPEDMTAAKMWKFGNGSLESWTWAGMSDVSVGGSNLTFMPESDPQLVKYGLEMDLKAIPYVRIRAHYENTSNSYLQVFFTTEADPGFAEAKAAIYTLDPALEEEGMHDIYVDMSNFASWSGTLTQLRIDPITSSDGKIEIESVELLYDEDMAKAIDEENNNKPETFECTVDDTAYEFNYAPYARGYSQYAALSDIADVFGWSVDYDYYGNITNVMAGDKLYRLNGSSGKVLDGQGRELAALRNKYIIVDEITYVDSKFTEYITGSNFVFRSEDGGVYETLTVSDSALLWDFLVNEGSSAWIPSVSLANVYLGNSWFVSTVSGYYPMLQTKLPSSIKAEDIKGIAIKLVNETASQKGILRFSNRNGEWLQNYAFEFGIKPFDSDGTEYYIETNNDIVKLLNVGNGNVEGVLDTNANVNFKGNISDFRFEFDDSPGLMAIDYIRIDLKEKTEEGN